MPPCDRSSAGAPSRSTSAKSPSLIARSDRVVVDLGTGDGRAVLRRAAAEPSALVIGIDAAASAMAEASRRADRRGPTNALFLAAGVEALSASPLAGRADLVTVTVPVGFAAARRAGSR